MSHIFVFSISTIVDTSSCALNNVNHRRKWAFQNENRSTQVIIYFDLKCVCAVFFLEHFWQPILTTFSIEHCVLCSVYTNMYVTGNYYLEHHFSNNRNLRSCFRKFTAIKQIYKSLLRVVFVFLLLHSGFSFSCDIVVRCSFSLSLSRSPSLYLYVLQYTVSLVLLFICSEQFKNTKRWRRAPTTKNHVHLFCLLLSHLVHSCLYFCDQIEVFDQMCMRDCQHFEYAVLCCAVLGSRKRATLRMYICIMSCAIYFFLVCGSFARTYSRAT